MQVECDADTSGTRRQAGCLEWRAGGRRHLLLRVPLAHRADQSLLNSVPATSVWCAGLKMFRQPHGLLQWIRLDRIATDRGSPPDHLLDANPRNPSQGPESVHRSPASGFDGDPLLPLGEPVGPSEI